MVVKDPWSSVQLEETLDLDYVQGLKYASQDDWPAAHNSFAAVMARIDHFHVFYNLYASADGLAKVMTGDSSGLNQCRQAVLDDPKRADLYENLVRACLYLRQRKKAVDALNKGLRVLPHHAGLNRLRREMGYRRHPLIPFLSRDNPINRFIGRKTYRR